MFFSDQFRVLNNFPKAVNILLKNQFTRTGGLDSFNKKRIHRRILDNIILHHDKNAIPSYLSVLSESPVRKELYQEFNLNSYFKKSLDLENDDDLTIMSLINMPNLSFALSKEHLEGYIKNQLSMNYHVYFDQQQKNELAKYIIEGLGKNHEFMIEDNLTYANCNEFQFLGSDFYELLTKATQNCPQIDEGVLSSIIRDYSRVQYGQRLNLAFVFREEFSYDIDYSNTDEFYRSQMIAKHERMWLKINLEHFLDAHIEYAKFIKNKKLESQIESFKKVISTERPPFLNEIPDYINSWRKDYINKNKDIRTIVS